MRDEKGSTVRSCITVRVHDYAVDPSHLHLCSPQGMVKPFQDPDGYIIMVTHTEGP